MSIQDGDPRGKDVVIVDDLVQVSERGWSHHFFHHCLLKVLNLSIPMWSI